MLSRNPKPDTATGPSLYAPDDYTAECWAEHLLSERAHKPRSWRHSIGDAIEIVGAQIAVWAFDVAGWVRR